MQIRWKPFDIFYGWWIVVASFIIALLVGGTIYYGFTTIFEPIAFEMGWTYTQISIAASLRGLEIGLLSPIMGLLVDRWGPKRVIFIGGFLAAAGLLLLSRSTSLGVFYGSFIMIGIGISGCTIAVLLTAIANWFHKNIGLASGIAASGFGCSGLIIPLLVRLIDSMGWRSTMTILAFVILAVVLALSLLFRHKPEQYGMHPDGQKQGPSIENKQDLTFNKKEESVGVKQAIAGRNFWQLTAALGMQFIILSAVVTHVMPFLSSVGVSRATAGLAAAGIPLMSVAGRIGLGWLGDKVNRKIVAGSALAMVGVAMFCFALVSSDLIWLLVPFLLLFGIGYGGSIILNPSLVRDLFGRANFGSIYGLILGITCLGNIIGPFVAGWAFDNLGAYQMLWFIFAGLSVGSVFLMLSVRKTR